MAQTTTEHTDPFALVRTLRDEVKLRIHLADMEARQLFEQVDAESERLLTRAESASKQTLERLIGKLQKLQRSVGRP
jgi:hypothetical protein